MRKTLYCILFIIGVHFVSGNQITVFASNSNKFCSSKSSSKVILRGSLPNPTTRGVFLPIEVFLSETGIDIHCLCDLGEIEISIIDEQGITVFNETVAAKSNTRLYIDLEDFPEGIYDIRFRNTTGDELSGMFNAQKY